MQSVVADAPAHYDFPDLLNGDAVDAETLAAWLVDARRRTCELTEDLADARELGPYLSIVNPPLWELAHIAWFQEYWCVRFRNGAPVAPSIIDNADARYNSAIAAHASRWQLPLLPWREMTRYQDDVLQRTLAQLSSAPLTPQAAYFALLSVLHEDMHGEALLYTRQTLGYARPRLTQLVAPQPLPNANEDIEFPAGEFQLGAASGGGFAFDNERGAHRVRVDAFTLASRPVTMAEFAAFVDDGGYTRDALWDEAGAAWKRTMNARCPLYWRNDGGRWWVREFDAWIALDDIAANAMMFVNAYEAQAYCRWAKRRLPTEAEWEYAARLDGDNNSIYSEEDVGVNKVLYKSQQNTVNSIGLYLANSRHVWEWTADAFAPYPEFRAGPYREYSQPWFGDHRVLRGGCFATRARLLRPTYRNFYTPDRRDVFAGFRTGALGD